MPASRPDSTPRPPVLPPLPRSARRYRGFDPRPTGTPRRGLAPRDRLESVPERPGCGRVGPVTHQFDAVRLRPRLREPRPEAFATGPAGWATQRRIRDGRDVPAWTSMARSRAPRGPVRPGTQETASVVTFWGSARDHPVGSPRRGCRRRPTRTWPRRARTARSRTSRRRRNRPVHRTRRRRPARPSPARS